MSPSAVEHITVHLQVQKVSRTTFSTRSKSPVPVVPATLILLEMYTISPEVTPQREDAEEPVSMHWCHRVPPTCIAGNRDEPACPGALVPMPKMAEAKLSHFRSTRDSRKSNPPFLLKPPPSFSKLNKKWHRSARRSASKQPTSFPPTRRNDPITTLAPVPPAVGPPQRHRTLAWMRRITCMRLILSWLGEPPGFHESRKRPIR